MVKLVLNRPIRQGLALFALAVGMVALFRPSPARAEFYFFKDANGVFHFSETPHPGAQPFRVRSGNGTVKPAERRPAHRKPARRQPVARHAAYDHLIAEYSNRYGVNPALVKAVIHAESNFRPAARSRKGARGLMQLMPRTASAYGVSASQLHDPRHNIRAGVRHLKTLIRLFGSNPRLVAAAYNAGQGNVRRYKGIPPFGETRRYVKKVLRYRALYSRESALASAADGMSAG